MKKIDVAEIEAARKGEASIA